MLQISEPGKVALVSVRSFEVQEDAAGNVVVVWEKACEENKQTARRRTGRYLLIKWVKGRLINNDFFKV